MKTRQPRRKSKIAAHLKSAQEVDHENDDHHHHDTNDEFLLKTNELSSTIVSYMDLLIFLQIDSK